MTRREGLVLMMAGMNAAQGADELRVDGTALERELTALSKIGRPPGGTFSSGVTRVGYSDEDLAGRAYVMGLMKKAGAKVRIDAAGNVFAEREGRDASLKPLLIGSHADTVPSGGNFDGCLGVMAAVQILQLLEDRKVVTRRPLAVVIWACEESSFAGLSLNGSRAAVGAMKPEELQRVSRGMTKAEAIRKIGGDPEHLEKARIAPGDYFGYLELHIEQGGTLERKKVQIGVVDGIVAIDDYDVVIEGMANHAGTTPMADRKDAMVAAAQLTLAVREEVLKLQGAQVGTVGHLDVTPNTANVIPGQVQMSVEFRDLSLEKLNRLEEAIRSRAAVIGRENGTPIRMTRAVRHEPALATPEFQKVIERVAGRLGLSTMHLPSGAGHDAQQMAKVMPMGMIFVPSIAGISHSPKELTLWEDCTNGANVLLGAVLELAG